MQPLFQRLAGLARGVADLAGQGLAGNQLCGGVGADLNLRSLGLGQVAEAGYAAVICMRPDGEGWGQPKFAAIEEAGELFTSTTDAAIEKAIETKVAAAIKALSNTDELNGYAGREFDPENFSKKVQPKVKRERLSPEEKAQRITEKASPEQLEALAALLAARGIAIPSAAEVTEG